MPAAEKALPATSTENDPKPWPAQPSRLHTHSRPSISEFCTAEEAVFSLSQFLSKHECAQALACSSRLTGGTSRGVLADPVPTQVGQQRTVGG